MIVPAILAAIAIALGTCAIVSARRDRVFIGHMERAGDGDWIVHCTDGRGRDLRFKGSCTVFHDMSTGARGGTALERALSGAVWLAEEREKGGVA